MKTSNTSVMTSAVRRSGFRVAAVLGVILAYGIGRIEFDAFCAFVRDVLSACDFRNSASEAQARAGLTPGSPGAQVMPTLLVIDDEPSILYAFRQNFREPAYTVLTASSAAEGLEQIIKHLPDAVILEDHRNAGACAHQFDGDVLGLGIFDDIGQRFLHDPVKCNGYFGREVLLELSEIERTLEARALAGLPHLPIDRRG